jgi:flagellar hook assembly protein FlgD
MFVAVTMNVADLSPVGEEVLPRITSLDQNVPNPFNPMTEIHFALPRTGRVELAIYDLRGAKIRTLESGTVEAGRHVRVWMGEDDGGRRTSSGVYFYRLKTADETITRRMTLLK